MKVLPFFFNRDERRERVVAHPPRVIDSGAVRAVAPLDGQAGGTWIFANEAGCVGALLNYYASDIAGFEQGHDAFVSRGQLLLRLIASTKPEQIEHKLRTSLRSERFRPFHLLFLPPDECAFLWTWSGAALHGPVSPALPVTTSSWNSQAVEAARRQDYLNHFAGKSFVSPGELEAFHRGLASHPGAFGVLMDRVEARTVSYCRVDVDPHSVRMTYRDRLSGDRFAAPHYASLSRRKADAHSARTSVSSAQSSLACP